MRKDGFSDSHKEAPTPHRLVINYPGSQKPVKFRSISCGRGHSGALDAERNAWIFTAWGRPILLTSDVLSTKVDYTNKILQVESGWGFVSLLTEGGGVYVYWPLTEDDEFGEELATRENSFRNNEHAKAHAKIESGDPIIPCTSIRIDAAPLLLPAIPSNLPDFHVNTSGTTVSSDATVNNDGQVAEASDNNGSAPEGVKLVRIAAGDRFIIGLTNRGHVLSIDISGGDESREEGSGLAWLRGQWKQGLRRGWVYVGRFYLTLSHY